MFIKKFVINICLIIIVFGHNSWEINGENIVSVSLKNGIIRGKIETSVLGTQLNIFEGIPYAQPPIGPLRFRRPLPVTEWPKVFDAFQWHNPCYQTNKLGIAQQFMNKNISEDCLYLNIWTPNDSLDSIELKPVIFYIHGGALIYGSANSQDNTGEIISAKGDVVFVNVNYRLGAFGFLYAGTDDAPGNVGLWDQALALEWVNDNIKYFGGDPNKITIMGVSGGSWSVSLLIMSPITRNMFHNAVMQSGAHTDNLIDGEPMDRMRNWLKVSQLIGCNDANSSEFNNKIIECLKRVDPLALAQVIERPDMKFQTLLISPLVVVDGYFLHKRPSQMLSSGDFKQNINLMISTAANEGSVILAVDEVQRYMLNPVNLTLKEAIIELTQLSSELSDKIQINGKEVARVYFSGLPDNNDFDLYRRTIGIALGDYYFSCPTLLFAKEIFKKSHFKSNVYQYYFNANLGSKLSKWFGPSHGDDLYLANGVPLLNDDTSQEHKLLSEQMIQLFTDFAKYGKPTPQKSVEWPRYFTVDDNIIAPFFEITDELKVGTNFGMGLKITECEYLWKKYIL